MSSKKKLVISLSVAAAVLVAAIIAIVAVFAAAQQAVASSVKVTFRARNVDCAVQASWETNTQTGAEFANFTIAASEASTTYQKDVPDIDLKQGESGDVYLLLTYKFTNTSSRDMNVKLDSFTNKNFRVEYSDADLTNGTGVVIPGKKGEVASNDIFTVKIIMTDEALLSAEDIVMDVDLAWTLVAEDFIQS